MYDVTGMVERYITTAGVVVVWVGNDADNPSICIEHWFGDVSMHVQGRTDIHDDHRYYIVCVQIDIYVMYM